VIRWGLSCGFVSLSFAGGSMATLKANGGVVRRWVNARRPDFRLALCANGRFLIRAVKGRFRRWSDGGDAAGLVGRVEADGEWQEVAQWRKRR
jgi:hypothetical protein